MHPSHKKCLINCLTAFACCLATLIGIYLIIQRINQTSQQIRQTKENLANWNKKEAYFRELSMEREKISSDLIAIDQGFLDSEQIVQFIKELENLAQKSQIQQEIKGAQKIDGPIPSLNLNLSLEANFNQTLRYLAQLESLQYFNRLDKIQMMNEATKLTVNLESPDKIPSGSPIIKTTLDLTIFLTPKE